MKKIIIVFRTITKKNKYFLSYIYKFPKYSNKLKSKYSNSYALKVILQITLLSKYNIITLLFSVIKENHSDK